ncbi:uncharacterized protein LOC132736389 [Ruditapes philippinarum]|uniref:uncharacterized protein LOC132736389 n=1 Tax=Ruditapes philippinarum TaxID=129788 RepID=UPI00295A72AC|nr:uncharacterized protein LOC132736389 [Ruditapes philippinarum]
MLKNIDERASTRPKVRFDLPKEDQRESDLRELLMNVIEKYETRSQSVRSEEESEERCDEEYNITIPCIDVPDKRAFMQCALDEGEKAEQTFARIFKENNDDNKDLYSEREMRFVQNLRASDLVSLKVKEYTDMIVEEMGYLRFKDAVNFEDMTEETMQELMETHCRYTVIKQETSQRIESISFN